MGEIDPTSGCTHYYSGYVSCIDAHLYRVDPVAEDGLEVGPGLATVEAPTVLAEVIHIPQESFCDPSITQSVPISFKLNHKFSYCG